MSMNDPIADMLTRICRQDGSGDALLEVEGGYRSSLEG